MNVGLIDVDGNNFPNLALMKISTFHKNKNDNVRMINPIESLLEEFDIIYISKVFTFSEDIGIVNAKKVVYGGSGYDLKNKLPEEIEKQFPDYGLYNIKNTAYGFLTRGCPRCCPFCIVGEKEGCKSYKVADLKDFWNGQKNIEIMDPNLLASKDKYDLLQQLIDSKSKVNFNQGLDIRLMTDKTIELIKKMNYQNQIKMIHFAYDGMNQRKLIERKLKEFKEATKIKSRKTRVYILTNFNTTIEEDLYRVYKTVELGYDPFIMIYKKFKANKVLKDIARWVNNKFVFRSCKTFEEYKKGR